MRVEVDRDACCGAGFCVMSAPAVFDQSADGLVWLKLPEPPEKLHKKVRQAAHNCPANAIDIIE
jgi:ferredoxin